MQVTVYTTPTCPYCYQVKEYLKRQAIPYNEVDVATDSAAAAEMVRISGQQGVPVTVIDGQPVVGFDRPRLDEMLARARRPHLGAAVADAADMAAKGRTTLTRGAYVGRVRSGSLADRAGLQPGDVIVSLANQEIGSAVALESVMARLQPGHSIPLEFVRDGQRQRANIVV